MKKCLFHGALRLGDPLIKLLELRFVSLSSETSRSFGTTQHFLMYRCCLPFGKYFVKFGAYSSFYPEVVMLNYLANLAKSNASVLQVHHFSHDNGQMAYVVMEYIDLLQVLAETLALKTV